MNKENEKSDQLASSIAGIIKQGAVACLPFDTVYGFACDPTNKAALERVFELKGREKDQTIGLATDGTINIKNNFDLSSDQLEYIGERIPGKFTFILKLKDDSKYLFSKYCIKDGTVAVRIPDEELVLSIAKLAGGFIAQTSANKSGKPVCNSVAKVYEQFSAEEIDKIDLVIDGGEIPEAKSSTIIDLSHGDIRIVRE